MYLVVTHVLTTMHRDWSYFILTSWYSPRMVIHYWCRLTKTVLEKRPLNGCSIVVIKKLLVVVKDKKLCCCRGATRCILCLITTKVAFKFTHDHWFYDLICFNIYLKGEPGLVPLGGGPIYVSEALGYNVGVLIYEMCVADMVGVRAAPRLSRNWYIPPC